MYNKIKYISAHRQVFLESKWFSANRAFVQFINADAMTSHMRFELQRPSERFAALMAFVLSLSGVLVQVHKQRWLISGNNLFCCCFFVLENMFGKAIQLSGSCRYCSRKKYGIGLVYISADKQHETFASTISFVWATARASSSSSFG